MKSGRSFELILNQTDNANMKCSVPDFFTSSTLQYEVILSALAVCWEYEKGSDLFVFLSVTDSAWQTFALHSV